MFYIDNSDKAYHICSMFGTGQVTVIHDNGLVLGHLAGVCHAQLDPVGHGVGELQHQAPGQGDPLLLDCLDELGQRGQLVVFLQFALDN
jgi:hypothetical protein